jgi:hypothetical protein
MMLMKFWRYTDRPQGLLPVFLFAAGIMAGCSNKDYNPPYQDPTILKIAVSGTIAGDSVAAAGSQVQYGTYSLQSSAGYTWSVPSDATILSGEGTNNITVQFGLDSGTVRVVSGSLSAEVISKVPFQVTGPSGVPVGTTATYQSTASQMSGVTYQWTVPADATITSGAGTNQINVLFTLAGTVSVTCQATSSTTTRSATIAVTAQ